MGKTSLICQRNGQWSDSLPSCQGMKVLLNVFQLTVKSDVIFINIQLTVAYSDLNYPDSLLSRLCLDLTIILLN